MVKNEQITRINKICRSCNKPFSIADKEAMWLKDHGLALFTRCSECRKKRREQNGQR